MKYACYLYDFNASFCRLLQFTKSDVILFLHDLEKPWRIEVMEDGTDEWIGADRIRTI